MVRVSIRVRVSIGTGSNISHIFKYVLLPLICIWSYLLVVIDASGSGW